VAIAGATEIALSLAKTLSDEPYAGMRLVGFYDDRNSDRRLEVPETYGGVIGDLNQLVTDAPRSTGVTERVVGWPPPRPPRWPC